MSDTELKSRGFENRISNFFSRSANHHSHVGKIDYDTVLSHLHRSIGASKSGDGRVKVHNKVFGEMDTEV